MEYANSNSFALGREQIGTGHPCFIIAEVAQAHDGSLGMAHAFIDAAAKAGANAVKFQTHIAIAESTLNEPFRVPFSSQDATRYAYWKRMEFTPEQWAGLARHCEDRGVVFLSSPFSIEAFELLNALKVAGWKVAAGEIFNLPLLRAMTTTRRPLLLSTGLANWAEIDRAVMIGEKANCPVALLQATSRYPCPAEKVGLNVLSEFRARYRLPIGLSDHSGTIFPGLAAATLGASLVEVHVTFSRDCFGPDVTSSVTISELAEMIRGIRFIEKMIAHHVHKDDWAKESSEIRRLFTRSIVTSRPLRQGEVLTATDVCFKKPGTGIPPDELSQWVGRRLSRDLPTDHLLSGNDFEQS